MEPPNKGQFGANSFVPCREVVPISEVTTWCHNTVSVVDRLSLSQRAEVPL